MAITSPAVDRIASGVVILVTVVTMSVPRVYYDNVIASARIRGEMWPASEMAAIQILEEWHANGRIRRVTSKMSGIEQARTTSADLRATLASRAHEVSVVPNDHRLLGFSTLDDGVRGFISSPIISDIIDEALYAKLTALGITDADDAKHLMYAHGNACEYFVTHDTRDILPNREAIDAVCSPMRVVTPSELVAKLAGGV